MYELKKNYGVELKQHWQHSLPVGGSTWNRRVWYLRLNLGKGDNCFLESQKLSNQVF